MPEPFIIVLIFAVPIAWLVLTVVAFVVALQSRRQLHELQSQMEQLQRDVQYDMGALQRKLREQTSSPTPPLQTPAPAPPVAASPTAEAQHPPVAPPAGPKVELPPLLRELVEPPVPVAQTEPVATPRPQPSQPPRPPMPPPPAPAQPKRTLEERLGTQLPIWIGAIALGIGGIWLAKYLFDHNIFTRPMRVVSGSLLGVALLAAGAWGHKRNRHIAAAVVAAGVADLYGWVFAAASMYHLIPIWLGFALMVVITAAAVGLSLRQGPIVAVVGMVGAFLTPVLLRTGTANVGVFAYLFLLQVGLLVVTRRKGWWPLAALTLAGSLIWAGGWVIGMAMHTLPLAHGRWVGLFMLGSAATMVFGADDGERPSWPMPGVGRVMAWVALLASLGILAMVVQVSHFAPMEWALMGVLAAGCLALGRLRKPYEPLAWLAAAAVLTLVTMWAVQVDRSGDAYWFTMAWAMVSFASLFTFGPFICAWGASHPQRWFGLSAGSTVAWFVLAQQGLVELPTGWKWWMIALITAGVLAAMSAAVQRRRATLPDGEQALAWLLIGSSVMLAIAAVLGLSGWHVTLAWAIEVPVLAIVGCWLGVRRLRWMTLVVAAGVLVRLVLNPHVLRYPISEHVVLNWISYGYGIAIIAFALAAWIYTRYKQSDTLIQAVLEGGAVLLGFALVSLEIRHGFHPAFGRHDLQWLEAATYINAWMACALVLLAGALWHGGNRRSVTIGGYVIGVIALGAMVIALGSPLNPLIGDVNVGSHPLVNGLLYAYGLPIVWCAAGAWLIGRDVRQALTPIGGIALALLCIWLSLEIRHDFHPAAMKFEHASLVEAAAYCIAWLALAIGLMTAGRWLQRPQRPQQPQRSLQPLFERGGYVIGVLGIIAVLVGLLGVKNPWWADEPVGAMRVLNWLLLAYGLPAVLCSVWARLARRMQPAMATFGGVVSVVLMWLLVTLEVRQWFAGAMLNGHHFTTAEQYTYSVAWVLLGLGLLAAGIVVHGRLVRFASLAVMLLAACKVFIFDTRELDDLYRVFSFLGLGVSLLLLAFLYQRFVFRRSSVAGNDRDPDADPPELA